MHAGLGFSVGLSYFQYADLNSARNLFVIGAAAYWGLCYPLFFKEFDENIDIRKRLQTTRILT